MKKIIRKFFFPFVNEKYELENKWWHRLLKVIFIIILILSFVWMLFWFWVVDKVENLVSYENEESSAVSLFSTANANNSQEFWQEDIDNFRDLLSKWVEPERAKNLILQAKWQTQPTQEQWLSDIFKNIWVIILFMYIINISLQFIYYKMFLYIIYWKK